MSSKILFNSKNSIVEVVDSLVLENLKSMKNYVHLLNGMHETLFLF